MVMSKAVLFFLFRERDARLASFVLRHWREQGLSVHGVAVCYRQGAADLVRREPLGLWAEAVSEQEMPPLDVARDEGRRTLDRFEALYCDPNIWRQAVWDRYLVLEAHGGNLYRYGTRRTRHEILGIVGGRLRAVESLVERHAPVGAAFVSIDVGSGTALATFQVVSARSIPTVVPFPNRLGAGTILSDHPRRLPTDVLGAYEALRGDCGAEARRDAARFIMEFREGKVGMRVRQRTSPARGSGESGSRRRTWPGGIEALRSVRDRGARSVRRRYFSHLRSRWDNVEARRLPHVLMPLHLEPELALLAYAPEFYDQVAVARQVAQALPWDHSLAIREHPVVAGQRPLRHYYDMSRIPNAHFSDVKVSGKDAISASEGVVTITGSAALEAVILGKPAVVLGNVWFDACNSILSAPTPARLPDVLNGLGDPSPEEGDVESFVGAILRESQPYAISSLSRSVWGASFEFVSQSDTFRDYSDSLRRRILATSTAND